MNEGVTVGGTTGPEETVAVPMDFRVVVDSTVVSGGATELVAASRDKVEQADRLQIASNATTAFNEFIQVLYVDVMINASSAKQSVREERRCQRRPDSH